MGREFEALSGKILEAAVAVHKALGPHAGRETCGPLLNCTCYFVFSFFALS